MGSRAEIVVQLSTLARKEHINQEGTEDSDSERGREKL